MTNEIKHALMSKAKILAEIEIEKASPRAQEELRRERGDIEIDGKIYNVFYEAKTIYDDLLQNYNEEKHTK